MPDDLKFQCFSCKKVNSLKLRPLEEQRVAALRGEEKPRLVQLTRACLKCGTSNVVSVTRKVLQSGETVLIGSKS